MGAVVGGLSHDETSIGVLHVDFDGTKRDLIVFEAHNDDSGARRLDEKTGEFVYLNNRANITEEGHVLFRDATSGHETYGGAGDWLRQYRFRVCELCGLQPLDEPALRLHSLLHLPLCPASEYLALPD